MDTKTQAAKSELEHLKLRARIFASNEDPNSLRQLVEAAISFAEVIKARHKAKESNLKGWYNNGNKR